MSVARIWDIKITLERWLLPCLPSTNNFNLKIINSIIYINSKREEMFTYKPDKSIEKQHKESCWIYDNQRWPQ